MANMRAVQVTRPGGPLELVERPVPEPGPGWVRIKAAVSGIPQGERCRLEVVARDGTAVLAGSWVVSAAGAAGSLGA